MRKINLIIMHCSASNKPEHNDISVMNQWHELRGFLRKPIPLGASNKIDFSIGYHFFIKTDGTIQIGREIEEIGAHCEHFNSHSIGICLHGLNKEDFTETQFKSARDLVAKYLDLYKLEISNVLGHNQLNKNKLCPVYDVQEKIINGLFN